MCNIQVVQVLCFPPQPEIFESDAFSSCIGRAKGAYCKVVVKHPGRTLQGSRSSTTATCWAFLYTFSYHPGCGVFSTGMGGGKKKKRKIDLKVFSTFWLSFSFRQPQGETDCINASSWWMRLTCIMENMEPKWYCLLRPELGRRDHS